MLYMFLHETLVVSVNFLICTQINHLYIFSVYKSLKINCHKTAKTNYVQTIKEN